MAKKRFCVNFSEQTLARLEIIAKLSKKKKEELIETAVKKFIEKEIIEKDIDVEATDLFFEDKISREELELLLGKARASAAITTKKIKGKAREFIDVVD